MTGEDYAYGPKTRKSGIAKEFKKESAGPDGHALSPSWNRPAIFFRVLLLASAGQFGDEYSRPSC